MIFQAISLLLTYMTILNTLNLALVVLGKPLVIDSAIYTIDIPRMEVIEQTLVGTAIDYSIDDFLYILTNRYLYKIDYEHLSINDRIPLPQRFNYLTTDSKNIILITTDEIIIIDKYNLAFKKGIGIERGDYRPIIPPRQLNTSEKDRIIHLIAESGKNSIMKIFDLNNGRLKRKATVRRVLSYEFNPQKRTLTTLDINSNLTVYDINLRKKEVFELDFDGKWFSCHENGYLVYSREGIFSVNASGKLVDFQPVPIDGNSMDEKFILSTEHGIMHLDSLTLRPKRFYRNDRKILHLFQIRTEDLHYIVTLDNHSDFQAINVNTMESTPIEKKKMIIEEREPTVVSTDSLWYFQLGAFAHYDNALEVYNNFMQKTIPVIIDSADLYRVKFGGFRDKLTGIDIVENINCNGWFVFQKKLERQDLTEFYVGSQKYIFEDGIIKRGVNYEENN